MTKTHEGVGGWATETMTVVRERDAALARVKELEDGLSVYACQCAPEDKCVLDGLGVPNCGSTARDLLAVPAPPTEKELS